MVRKSQGGIETAEGREILPGSWALFLPFGIRTVQLG